MSSWKRLMEMVGEADWKTGYRTNSIWDRAAELDRRPASAPQKAAPKAPAGPPQGQDVWRGTQMKDNDLFKQTNDKKTGKPSEAGLLPALKQNGGTVSRAPDGSGIGIVPNGYRIDTSVWKDWRGTRAQAQMDAVTGGNPVKRNAYDLKGGQQGQRNRLPADSRQPTKTYDVLIQGKMNGEDVVVTKVVWAPVDVNSLAGQDPDARQAKLDLLMDTDDPSELAQMFPAQPQQNTLGKPPKPAAQAPNPLASPTKVQWTKGADSVSQDPARPSAWDEIDLTRPPKKKV